MLFAVPQADKVQDNMKQVGYLFILLLWVMGGIGGAGYAIYNNAWPIAVGAVVNAVLAFPKVREYFKKTH